jgi:hypothetical protein
MSEDVDCRWDGPYDDTSTKLSSVPDISHDYAGIFFSLRSFPINISILYTRPLNAPGQSLIIQHRWWLNPVNVDGETFTWPILDPSS